jgi:hypothetical protein
MSPMIRFHTKNYNALVDLGLTLDQQVEEEILKSLKDAGFV